MVQILQGRIEKGKVIGFSEHAERSALHACRITHKFDGMVDVWVMRFKDSGHLSNSHPCDDCLQYMRENKVRRVYYSTDEGVKCQKLIDMKPIKRF